MRAEIIVNIDVESESDAQEFANDIAEIIGRCGYGCTVHVDGIYDD